MQDDEIKSSVDMVSDPDAFMRDYQGVKEANNRRFAEIDRLKRTVDELALKSLRPALSGHGPHAGTSLQHKTAFTTYVRSGETGSLRELEQEALSAGSAPDGGYLVPAETESVVLSSLKSVSPIRAIAGIRQVSGNIYKKPFSISGPGTGWVGDAAARPETTSPTLAELSFPTMELYAMPAATATLLEDSAVNIDQWIAEEVRDAFAEQEGAAFVNGDGVNKPRGFLDYPKVANALWSWGNLGFITSGAAGAFAAGNPADKLINLIYAVRAEYRANASFVMNGATQAAIRKFKDADGNYIWQPAQRPGETPSLLGYPVVEAEDMPSVATDSFAIAFGDFRRGYLIVDRIGIRVLRDPFSSKPYVLFYTTKRVGGGVQDFDAIKLLKFAA